MDWMSNGVVDALSQVRGEVTRKALDAECIHDLICSIEDAGEKGRGRQLVEWSVIPDF